MAVSSLFWIAVGLVGCGSAVGASPLQRSARTVPCPARPSTSALAAAGARAERGPPVASVTPAAAAMPAPTRVTVTRFDCFSTLEEKRTESLRGWASGGPDGAAWNLDGAPLLCEVTLTVPCAGAVALQVLGNTTRLARRDAAVAAGENRLELSLPARQWERALDGSLGPYRTLLLAVGGFVTCGTAAGGERLHFADAFVAGFSGGE